MGLTTTSIWKNPTCCRRCAQSARSQEEPGERMVVWGSGRPTARNFYTSTIWQTRVCSCSQDYDSPEIINVGSGEDLTIRELAELICEVVGFEGELTLDTTKPDGTPRKLLDVAEAHHAWAGGRRFRLGKESHEDLPLVFEERSRPRSPPRKSPRGSHRCRTHREESCPTLFGNWHGRFGGGL